MGEAIPVVHDRASAAAYAPLRLPQVLRVPGSSLRAFANPTPRGSFWGWINATFAADPALCELFPSLEYPTSRLDPSDGPWRRLEDDQEGRVAISVTDLPDGRSIAGEVTAIGEGLGGAQPVLIYRQRPGLLEALNLNQGLGHPTRGEHPDTPRAQEVAAQEGLPTSYGQEPNGAAPLMPVDWYRLTPSDVWRVDVSWDDADRLNAVAVNLAGVGGAGVEVWGYLGEAITGSRRELEQHGVRLLDVDWPIVPPSVVIDDLSQDIERLRGQIGDKLTALAEIAWALGSGEDGDFFPARARVTGRFNPFARAGHWLVVDAGEGGPFAGYIDAVTHSIRNDQSGRVISSSTYTLSRVTQGLAPRMGFPLRFSDAGDFVTVDAG
jgi:hypothetical protein